MHPFLFILFDSHAVNGITKKEKLIIVKLQTEV